MTPIYRLDGRYFGFRGGDTLFDPAGAYLGWVSDDGKVWRANGRYVGTLAEGAYVLRHTLATMPADVGLIPGPESLPAPARWPDRPSRPPAPGYADALDAFDR